MFSFQASEVKKNIRLFNGFDIEKVCVDSQTVLNKISFMHLLKMAD